MIQLNKLLSIKLNQAITVITTLQDEISRLSKNNQDNQQIIQCLLTNEEQKATSDNEMDLSVSQFQTNDEALPATCSSTRNSKRKLTPPTTLPLNKKSTTMASQKPGANNTADNPEDKNSESKSIIADLNPTSQKASKILPIILRTKTNALRILRELDNKGVAIKDAVNRADCIKLHVESAQDFHQTTYFFNKNKIPYHTYQLPEEKLLKVVIRGIPEDINPEEVLEELQQLNYPAINATRMRSGPNRRPIPLILIQLAKPEGKDIINLTQIFYLRVRVEALRRKTEITRCHQCQKFGH